MNIQDIIAAPIDHAANGAERYSVHQLRSAFDLGALSAQGGNTKLRAALDSCLVAATIAEESGYEQNAKAIRATVSYIERVLA